MAAKCLERKKRQRGSERSTPHDAFLLLLLLLSLVLSPAHSAILRLLRVADVQRHPPCFAQDSFIPLPPLLPLPVISALLATLENRLHQAQHTRRKAALTPRKPTRPREKWLFTTRSSRKADNRNKKIKREREKKKKFEKQSSLHIYLKLSGQIDLLGHEAGDSSVAHLM